MFSDLSFEERKYVIYRGDSTSLVQARIKSPEDVTYQNVEEYLKRL
ncbi:MAG: hypothetical protein PUC49_05380 [Clostridiales bacterium]|nr:hypothetical protein [Clostridiales bacterium]